MCAVRAGSRDRDGAYPGRDGLSGQGLDRPAGPQLLMGFGERAGRFRFLIRDRNTNSTTAFDGGFSDNSTRVVKTPVRPPQANSRAGAGSQARRAASTRITC